jgi:putative ABC transport system permease protein
MVDLFGDVRCAVRSFSRSPLQGLLTVLILGVGIGAVTLMFSTMNASVLRPLPYPDPDDLVWAWKASDRISQNSLSYDDFRDYAEGMSAFEAVGAFYVFRPQVLVTGTEEAERIRSTFVTPGFFRTLGVPPSMGRSFLPEESVVGGAPVVIVSDHFWRSRLGGGSDITGRMVNIDGIASEVVGVMPPGFRFRGEVHLWLPAQEGAGYAEGRGNNNFFFVGRLRDGVPLTQARAQMDGIARQIQEAHPDFATWYHWLQPLHEVFYGDMRNVFLILLGIVALVPILACANVASLSLARATTRNAELATRQALGARRTRILRQLLVENTLLALMGGLLGLALAWGGGILLRNLGPSSIPRLEEIGLDGSVLTFGLLASLLTVPLFAALPALRGTDFDLARALRVGGRGEVEGRSRARAMLVVVQMALSMTLLISSGLLLRSFRSLQSEDPGFDTGSVLTAGVQLPAFKYSSNEQGIAAWESALARIEDIPGVEGVAGADWLPVNPGGGPWNSLTRPGHPLEGYDQGVPASRKFVSDDYFSVLGTPLLLGRPFSTDDRIGTPAVMILSEALAEILFPGENPLGGTVNLWGEPFQVVGVSRDVSEEGVGVVARPSFFISTGQYPQASLQLMIRVDGSDPLAAATAVRDVLRQEDPDIALTDIQTMEARVAGTLAQPRFRTTLVGGFALAGLFMAAFGLYGVLSFLVTRRQHEIGIRLAVGARPSDVIGLVVRHGLTLVGVGAALGLIGGGIAAVSLQSMLFGVSLADPLALCGSSAVLLLVALGASLLPAWKASRVDPLDCLRAE